MTRPKVFWQVAWRSFVSCIGGGAAIGAVLGLGFVVFDLVTNASDKTAITDIGMIAYVGGALGVFLGLVAAPVLGLTAAFTLVPYPGAQKTPRVMRIVAMVLVGLFSLMFLVGAHLDTGAVIFFVVLIVGGQIGAYLLAGWTVGWYIRRVDGAAAPEPEAVPGIESTPPAIA